MNYHSIIKISCTLGLLGLIIRPVYAESTNSAGRIYRQIKPSVQAEINRIGTEAKDRFATRTGLLKNIIGTAAILKNAELKSISGNTLVVAQDGKDYTVNVTDKTQLRRKFWGKSELSEFNQGDKLNVIGKWTDEAKTTLEAKLIRNLSLQKRFGVFFGTITAKSDSGFTLDTIKRGIQTVTIDTNTKYFNRKGETISFSDLATGHKVRVRGLWDSQLSKITEVTKVKVFSLPVRPSPKPSPIP